MDWLQLFVFNDGPANDYWSPWIPKTILDILLFILIIMTIISISRGTERDTFEKHLVELYLIISIFSILGGLGMLFFGQGLEVPFKILSIVGLHAYNYFWLMALYLILLIIRAIKLKKQS